MLVWPGGDWRLHVTEPPQKTRPLLNRQLRKSNSSQFVSLLEIERLETFVQIFKILFSSCDCEFACQSLAVITALCKLSSSSSSNELP